MKEPKEKEKVEWDKRKILVFIIAGLLLLVLLYGIKNTIIGPSTSSPNTSDVKGANTTLYPSPPDIKGTIQNQIDNLKTEAANINVADVATSSPQVQKVITDLKNLQNYPSTQLKSACMQICNGL